MAGFLAGWWISIPLVPESKIFLCALIGLFIGILVDVIFLKSWILHAYSMKRIIMGQPHFYLYPTASSKVNKDDPNIGEIDKPAMIAGAKLEQSTPKEDVFAGFDTYIKHDNNGRPFILAGHSQGSNELAYLLSEYMKENPKVYARMIAAYVIGYSITDKYLAANPHLKFAEGADDTYEKKFG